MGIHYDYKSTRGEKALKKEAKKSKRHTIIGADCNAQAGCSQPDDSNTAVGNYGILPENSRGQWLKTWASTENLVLTNTFFKKHRDKIDLCTGRNILSRRRAVRFVFWRML